MATGQKSFDMGNQEKNKRNFDPAPDGDYDLKLLPQIEIKTAQPTKNEKTGKMSEPLPRVGCRFEILGTALEEGGKNKLYFHDFVTSVEPGKDGKIPITFADQIKGLSLALGSVPPCPVVLATPGGTTKKVEIVDPRAIKQWLTENVGQVVRGHLKVQAGTKLYPDAKNRLTEFFEADGEAAAEDAPAGEEELPAEEYTEEAAEAPAEEGGELDALPAFEEEAPAPAKPAARPAPKPAPAPARRPAPAPAKKPVAKKR